MSSANTQDKIKKNNTPPIALLATIGLAVVGLLFILPIIFSAGPTQTNTTDAQVTTAQNENGFVKLNVKILTITPEFIYSI